MNSKRALLILMINQREVEDGWKLVDLKTNEKVSIDDCCDIVIKDLNRLEKLKQENQELKEKVNHFEKVIEVMQNSSKLDCTHMFDNCKKLTPLTEKKEHKMTSKEAVLELICEAKSVNRDEGRVSFLRKIIEKDLEIVECFRKIPKQDLRDFIDWQLRYEKMIKNWLDERPFLYVDKEDPTKHLIKIKEWLENE